jgi:hypothetical protein
MGRGMKGKGKDDVPADTARRILYIVPDGEPGRVRSRLPGRNTIIIV